MTVVVVTGAAAGIGEAVARRLSADGWDLVAVDRDEAGLGRLADGATRVRTVVGDVRERATHQAARAAAAELGELTAWVSVAGITVTHDLADLDEGSVRTVVDVNQLGTLWGAAEAVAAFMAAGTAGTVVSISSVHAHRAAEHYPVYEMTKAAVEALTRSIAVSYGRHGIRAVAIAPGAIWTPALRESLGSAADPAANTGRLERASALHRIGDAAEVAAAVAFALSPDAAYVTGSVIRVDGGWTAALLTDPDETVR